MIQQKAVNVRGRRNENSTQSVLRSICTDYGRDPTDLRNYPFNTAFWSQFASDCLWPSFWLRKDHEEFKRVAMNKSCPRTHVLIQSVQRRVQTLIERKDVYNVQVLQDWRTFRRSRITLLSDPAAKLIRMKVLVFWISTLPHPDPSNNWATEVNDVRNKHRSDEQPEVPAEETEFVWHVPPGASTIRRKLVEDQGTI